MSDRAARPTWRERHDCLRNHDPLQQWREPRANSWERWHKLRVGRVLAYARVESLAVNRVSDAERDSRREHGSDPLGQRNHSTSLTTEQAARLGVGQAFIDADGHGRELQLSHIAQ